MFGASKKALRLSQWKGRRHSSRYDEPLLGRLRRPSVVVRLGVAGLTTLAVTALAIQWGPPFPYRLGETYSYDLRARVDFDIFQHVELTPRTQSSYAEPGVVEQEDARFVDRPVIEKYPKGMILAARGQALGPRQMQLLREEHEAYVLAMTPAEEWSRGLALLLVFILLTVLVVLYVARFQPGLAESLPMITGICFLIFVTVAMSLILSAAPWHAVLLPLTVTAMIFTLAYNPQFALLMSFSLGLTLSLVLGVGVEHMLITMGGLAAAVLSLRHVRSRTDLVQVAFGAGLAYATMTMAAGMLTHQTWTLVATDAFRHLVWGSLAGFVLTGLLPQVERCFGMITDVSLLELADGAHPLLQELVKRAPGTYTHSITVATLAESAAEAIGANPLLVRVGSYFHDVGKMLKPQYFIENQSGANRHDILEPALSTLVIINHVKDGLALAQQYRLPRPIRAFIAQHHGTTLVEYFYREAMRQQEAGGLGSTDLEACFRYPGPKPQNRENGILMLADAVESTSRSLSHPTPGSLSKLVHDTLMKRLLDGQFEQSGLTLTELHLIEESLSKSLIALFHARIKYPEETVTSQAA